MLSFLFLRYLSWNYEEAAKKELGADYAGLDDIGLDDIGLADGETTTPLQFWYETNENDVVEYFSLLAPGLSPPRSGGISSARHGDGMDAGVEATQERLPDARQAPSGVAFSVGYLSLGHARDK